MTNCVYRLLSLDKSIKEFYIGSTADLKRRTGQHKSDCNNSNSIPYNFKVYKFIREHGGWTNWKIDVELLTTGMEKKDRLELEQNYIECLQPHLNSNNALGHDSKEYHKEWYKEYYEKNKESIKETNKKYYEDNKESINEKHKQYRQNNKESIKEYNKDYNEKNKESIKEYTKQYSIDNKDKINARRRERRKEIKLKKTKVI
tara:strand:- start:209 stop:814 length:606 start_codon:yes stop_codon:yes gene_type:complete